MGRCSSLPKPFGMVAPSSCKHQCRHSCTHVATKNCCDSVRAGAMLKCVRREEEEQIEQKNEHAAKHKECKGESVNPRVVSCPLQSQNPLRQ